MTVVYLVYGFSFLAGGMLLGFQARLSSKVVPRFALGCLAAFAVAHGLSEWAKMAVLIPGAEDRKVQLLGVGLGALSYLLLVEFGVEFYGRRNHWPAWSRALPGLLFTAFALLVAVCARDGPDRTWLRTVDAASRYAFGLPGSLLSAAVLLRLHRDRRAKGEVVGVPYLLAASAAFVAYGVLAGAIPPPAPFFPASRINAEAFLRIIHLPVEIPRTACALVIPALLSEAFVIRAERERQQWERQREEFIAVVAHDLRSPLAAIQLGAAMLERALVSSADPDREPTERVLHNIRRSAFRLERMVRDLLDSSRIEAKALALEVGDVDLRALVEGVIDRAGHVVPRQRVRTVLPAVLPAVRVDSERTEQILENLLSNAVKYGAPGTEITVEASVGPREVELAVTNLGQGLSPEDADRVFSRFYRSATHARRVAGLGLGLYIARGLAVAQGGRMWLDTEFSKYATFRFTLPRSDGTSSGALALDRDAVHST